MTETTLSGSCLCENVRWEIRAPLTPFAHCHCSVCRKTHGTGFATYMAAEPSALHWARGESEIAEYESSPGFLRRFCRRCGSTVPGVAPDGHIAVPPGSESQDPGVRAKIHLFVPAKASWYEIRDDLRQFDAFPKQDGPDTLYAGSDATGRRMAADPDREGGARLHGSCACGEIAYRVDTDIQAAHNCHCNRCRRARSAAHASNAFVPAEAVHFTRGEDLLVRYKVPDAKFFTQVFCRQCSSPMPNVDHDRGLGVIPYGSLDSHPNLTPQDHIYVADKAPWFEIADDLPQHGERPPG